MLRRSIVVPLYQESGRIAATVRRLAASPLHDDGTEFVFVDDGSTDGTLEVLQAAVADAGLQRAQILRLPGNRGKGAAVRTGVLASRGDVVAFVDADLSSPPSAIAQCLEAVERGAQVALASRAHATSDITVRQPSGRESAGKTFNRLIRLLGLTSLPDTQCGLKAFDRATALRLFGPLTIRRFAFDVEVLARAADLGLRIEAIPTQWAHVEQSRVSPLRDGVRMAWDSVRVARARRRAAGTPRPGGATDGLAPATPDVGGRYEREHWCFSAQRELVRRYVAEAIDPRDRGAAVDVGCRTGELLGELVEAGFGAVVGTDLDEHALHLAARAEASGARLLRASAQRLPLRDKAIDLVTSLGVVEHMDQDVRALTEYARVLRPGGHVVVSISAYEWAWSEHDVRLGHRRRYTRPRLEEALVAAGFTDVRVRYFQSWLVPLAPVLRRTPLRQLAQVAQSRRMRRRGQNDVGHALARLDQALELPFGLCLFATARRPG